MDVAQLLQHDRWTKLLDLDLVHFTGSCDLSSPNHRLLIERILTGTAVA